MREPHTQRCRGEERPQGTSGEPGGGMEDTGSGKDGARVGPRSRTLAREGVLFRGNNSHTHPPTAGGEADSGCSELEGVVSCHPVLPPCAPTLCSHANVNPAASQTPTQPASQAQWARSGCQGAELSSASKRADCWQPQTHPPVDPRVLVMQPLPPSTHHDDTDPKDPFSIGFKDFNHAQPCFHIHPR